MPILIEPYLPARVAAVKAFNQRLRDGGERVFSIAETPVPKWLPPGAGETLYEELFLATDGASVHGGYVLKHQTFAVSEDEVPVGFVYSPVSEGIVARQYGSVGLKLMSDAVRRSPLLYCLGMGGTHNALPQLLKAMGWTLTPVPFFFKVVNARAFLSNLTYASRYPGGRIATRVLAHSGLGWLGNAVVNATVARSYAANADLECAEIASFGPEADVIWSAGRPACSFAAMRDRHSLNRLYPASDLRGIRLLMQCAGKPVGWAVLLDSRFENHAYFGNARVGSMIDCFAVPGHEHDVVHGAMRHLQARGVDLMVSNQGHGGWGAALGRAGWLGGPSNFILAVSPKLADRLARIDNTSARIHMTRGDGEGPTHL